MKNIFLDKLISSFKSLSQKLKSEGIPNEIITQAIRANSWFTTYYIQKSLEGILSWESQIDTFLAQYPTPQTANFSPKKIGIIAAGNVPFVCMHDILMTVFSGNIALLKFSHQDNVLPKWLCEKWIEIMPNLAKNLHFVASIQDCDYLIATGSNNTANALNYQFSHIPKLIRKHRFSIAVIKNDINQEKLTSLCEDILLYNGLGCRNVSHIFVPKSFEIAKIENALNKYPLALLSNNYLQKLKENEARLQMLQQKYIRTRSAILQILSEIQFSNLGIINLICYENEADLATNISLIQTQIQCMIGLNVAYGQSQRPLLWDFADGEDTMALLLKLKE